MNAHGAFNIQRFSRIHFFLDPRYKMKYSRNAKGRFAKKAAATRKRNALGRFAARKNTRKNTRRAERK
jgi:hypothetical protein